MHEKKNGSSGVWCRIIRLHTCHSHTSLLARQTLASIEVWPGLRSLQHESWFGHWRNHPPQDPDYSHLHPVAPVCAQVRSAGGHHKKQGVSLYDENLHHWCWATRTGGTVKTGVYMPGAIPASPARLAGPGLGGHSCRYSPNKRFPRSTKILFSGIFWPEEGGVTSHVTVSHMKRNVWCLLLITSSLHTGTQHFW